jgi:hypothetical protein
MQAVIPTVHQIPALATSGCLSSQMSATVNARRDPRLLRNQPNQLLPIPDPVITGYLHFAPEQHRPSGRMTGTAGNHVRRFRLSGRITFCFTPQYSMCDKCKGCSPIRSYRYGIFKCDNLQIATTRFTLNQKLSVFNLSVNLSLLPTAL